MKINLLLLSLVVIMMLSCAGDNNTAFEIPKLLDRPEQLTGVEWDKIQNRYQSYSSRINQDPLKSDSYINLVEVFIHEARVTGEHGHYYPSALLLLDQALQIETEQTPERFNALLYKASVQLSQHDFVAAKELAEEALHINPINAQVYGTLVDANVELGEYAAAVSMADKMVSIRPDIRSYSRVSYLREIHGDMDGAIEAMKMAVESGYPGLEQTAWARLTLGELFLKIDDQELAKQEFQTILLERENYPFAIAALGSLELKKENYEEAEKLLNQAASIIPEVGFYTALASLYNKTNREQEYENILVEIKAMLKDDVDSGHNMNLDYADLHLNITQDLGKALEYTASEYKIRPKNADVNKMMSKIFLALDRKDESALHLEKASIVNKNSKELLDIRKQLLVAI